MGILSMHPSRERGSRDSFQATTDDPDYFAIIGLIQILQSLGDVYSHVFDTVFWPSESTLEL